MPNTLSQKLKINEGFSLLTIHAPGNFKEQLEPLPPGVKISASSKNYNQIHWFVINKALLEKELDNMLSLMKAGVTCWVYYPKGTSKMQTDLTRDKGWGALLKHDELTWISLISFDDTWSVFGFRLKSETDIKKETRSKDRAIFDYIDAKAKTVRLPDDLAMALKENKRQQEFFNNLAFTNRKEYVEWIITAKREDTRAQRLKDTIERLGKGWKNPANR